MTRPSWGPEPTGAGGFATAGVPGAEVMLRATVAALRLGAELEDPALLALAVPPWPLAVTALLGESATTGAFSAAPSVKPGRPPPAAATPRETRSTPASTPAPTRLRSRPVIIHRRSDGSSSADSSSLITARCAGMIDGRSGAWSGSCSSLGGSSGSAAGVATGAVAAGPGAIDSAAPRAIVVLGSASTTTGQPSRADTSWDTSGTREEPPTSSTAPRSALFKPAESIARDSESTVSSRAGRIMSSNSLRTSRTWALTPGSSTGMDTSVSEDSASLASMHSRRRRAKPPSTFGSSMSSASHWVLSC